MYIQVPAPVVLVDPEDGKPLSDENVTDNNGQTLKSLGIPYVNKPITMRKWFLRNVANLYKGYEETRAARRTEKALAKAETDRVDGGPLPIVEIGKDDTGLLRGKIKMLDQSAVVLFNFEAFLEAIEKMSEERPGTVLKSVESESAG